MVVCPNCGAHCELDLAVLECPKCGYGEVAEDGLLFKEVTALDGSAIVCQVGKGGFVVCRGRSLSERFHSVLEAILRLDEQRSSQGKIIDIEQANQRIWNSDRARRLFHRLLHDNDNKLPAIDDAALVELARRLRDEQAEEARESEEDDWSMEQLHEWVGSGFIYELKEHDLRVRTEPLLYSSHEVPEALRRAFDEARECYRWGRFLAAVGLSRVIVENAIKQISKVLKAVGPQDRPFREHVQSISPEVLPESDKDRAMSVWNKGRFALHKPGAIFGENDAWQALAGC